MGSYESCSTLCTIPHWCASCHLSPPNIHVGFPFVVNNDAFLTSTLACNHSITTMHAYLAQLRSPDHHTKPTTTVTCKKIFLSSLYLRSLTFLPNKNQIPLFPMKWSFHLLFIHLQVICCTSRLTHVILSEFIFWCLFHYVWSRPTCTPTWGFQYFMSGFAWMLLQLSPTFNLPYPGLHSSI